MAEVAESPRCPFGACLQSIRVGSLVLSPPLTGSILAVTARRAWPQMLRRADVDRVAAVRAAIRSCRNVGPCRDGVRHRLLLRFLCPCQSPYRETAPVNRPTASAARSWVIATRSPPRIAPPAKPHWSWPAAPARQTAQGWFDVRGSPRLRLRFTCDWAVRIPRRSTRVVVRGGRVRRTERISSRGSTREEKLWLLLRNARAASIARRGLRSRRSRSS
jgi:hypothetical protein